MRFVKTTVLASIIICSAPFAHAGDSDGFQPAVYFSLNFGGNGKAPISNLNYGVRMDYNSATVRQLAAAPRASDFTLRDEVQTLSSMKVPSMLRLDFTADGFRQANLAGVPLRAAKFRKMRFADDIKDDVEPAAPPPEPVAETPPMEEPAPAPEPMAAAEEPPAEEPVEEEAEGDGPMGVSWWWWGLGALLLAGGAYALLDDDDDEAAAAGGAPPAEECDPLLVEIITLPVIGCIL